MLAQKGGRSWLASPCPKPWRRDNQMVGNIKASPAKMPGTMPAANKAGTEAPGTNTLYTIKAMEGGIKISVAAAAPMTDAEKADG